jgi:hypothetical protein
LQQPLQHAPQEQPKISINPQLGYIQQYAKSSPIQFASGNNTKLPEEQCSDLLELPVPDQHTGHDRELLSDWLSSTGRQLQPVRRQYPAKRQRPNQPSSSHPPNQLSLQWQPNGQQEKSCEQQSLAAKQTSALLSEHSLRQDPSPPNKETLIDQLCGQVLKEEQLNALDQQSSPTTTPQDPLKLEEEQSVNPQQLPDQQQLADQHGPEDQHGPQDRPCRGQPQPSAWLLVALPAYDAPVPDPVQPVVLGQLPGRTDPLTLTLPQLVPLHLKQGAVVVKYGPGGASAGRNCN